MVSVSLPEVAMLDVEGSDVTLEFGRPTNAGAPIVTPTNNAKWLNYTSAVAAGSTRSVAVSISQTIPGLDIKLQPVAALGGNGTLGTPALPVTLSTNPQTIISGIGGGYTGNGTGNGHQLLFSAVPNNYADITASVHTLSVIYTISDDGAFPSEIVPVTVNNVPNSVTIPTITEAGNDYGMPTPNGNPIILNYTFDNDMLSSPGADLFESGSIKVKMQYDPTTTWDPSLHLYAQRNGGSASLAAASYSGGFPYVEIPGATSVPFFDLIWNDQSTEPGTTVTYSDIPVSIQLSGVSVLIPAATYSAQILFVAEK
ncbi:hypothetical protein [Arundinibacter roseus]|uniref:hypothetical protein n=1 Tax=Arundinibacter roseus TaxID=2070510 RepID=UPI0018FE434F|nr:hypothetical protein [Arundinibacter roseus]